MKYCLIYLTLLIISCSTEQPKNIVDPNPLDTTGKGSYWFCFGNVPDGDTTLADYCTRPSVGKWKRCMRYFYLPVLEPQRLRCKFRRHFDEGCK
jgi:hypothetical protein